MRYLLGVAVFLLGVETGCPADPLSEARAHLAAGRIEQAGDRFLAEARNDPALLGAWDGAVDSFCKKRFHVARCLEVLDLELELLGSVARHHDALSVSLETRARARIEAGLPTAALSDLARAARAAPERATVPVAEALALSMLGRRSEALQALARARSLNPGLEEIDQVRARIPGPDGPPPSRDEGDEGFGGSR